MFMETDDLRRDRVWLRLTTAALAQRAGISAARLSKIETGRVRVSSDDRRRLSQALAARRKELSEGTEVRFERDAQATAAA
jgi:transcriptional regulator with XRE-family HTH domain